MRLPHGYSLTFYAEALIPILILISLLMVPVYLVAQYREKQSSMLDTVPVVPQCVPKIPYGDDSALLAQF